MKTASIIFCIIASGIFACAAHANIITNADFESGGYAPFWSAKNAASLGLMAVSNGANHTGGGTYALRVSGRTGSSGSQAGPTANITSGLTAQGSGKTWTTRVWVKLDAYASVRVMVQHAVNSIALPPLIFAECVVLTPGTWVQVTGTQTLSWSGTLTQAQIYLEIEQLQRSNSSIPAAQSRFPDYWLDDISVDLDDDGDSLLNSEESTDHVQMTISFADNADSDSDGIPDDFERKFPTALDPRNATDAALDFDHDGWSNIEEYTTATDPADALSLPALSDPEATLAARALHRYLIHLAATGRHLVGQMVGDVATDYAPYVDGLANLPGGGGRYPAVLGLAPEGFTAPLDFATDAQTAAQYVAAGGIITLNWQIYNPWVKSDSTFGNANYIGTATDNYRVDILGLVATNGVGVTTNSPASNLAARAALLDWCDQTATLLKQHLPGVPILMRPFHEMNGGWFWWGHRTREEYTALWTLVRDRFVTYHDMHNLLWVCSASGNEHVPLSAFGSGTSVEYYYPGDGLVDVVGAHFYENFTSPFDVDRVWARHPKILAMPEFGSALSTRMSSGFDNRWVINAIRTRMPRVAYFTCWNSWTNHDDDDNNPVTNSGNDDAYPLLPDTPTHKYIAIAENGYAAALLADPGVVTRDEVAFMPPASLGANAESSTGFALAWPSVTGNTGYRIEISTTGAPDSWTTSTSTAPNIAAATLGGFTPKSTCYFRIRSLFGSDDTLPTDAINATTWSHLQQWKNDTLGDFAAPDYADADADGLVNLLEYGFCTHPLTTSQAPTHSVVNVSGSNYLALTFRRRVAPSDVSVIVEATSDLLHGPWLPEPVLFGTPVDNGDGTETVIFRDIIPTGGVPSRFLRLRMTLP